MQLKEITTKEQWEEKMSLATQAQFLQSWEWGEFQIRLKRKIWRLDINGEYVLVIKMPLPLKNNYLYISRSAVKWTEEKFQVIKDIAVREKSLFIRLEPLSHDLLVEGFRTAGQIQPQKTLYLDLQQDEASLLEQMHPKTRYNIRLAAKKGVQINLEHKAEGFAVFYDLLLDTYCRKKKNLHSREYYQCLYRDHLAKIVYAEYEGKILCANMIIFYGDTVTYLHGGSSSADKSIMAPHLAQWETIKMAKSLGYKFYDFWGIDDQKWPGVTRFKKGFGGFEVDYSGAWEYPLNKFLYFLYSIIKKIK